MLKQLVIIGAGGVGREIAAVLKKHPLKGYKLVGFIDDAQPVGTLVNGLSILGSTQWVMDNAVDLGVILAFGNPQVRKKVIEKFQTVTLEYPSLIHPNVSVHDEETVVIGNGCYIADGCILTTNIVVEDFCFLNSCCTLQHDSYISYNCVFMPGVRITGGARIGNNTYIAPNCVIATNTQIESDSFITTSII